MGFMSSLWHKVYSEQSAQRFWNMRWIQWKIWYITHRIILDFKWSALLCDAESNKEWNVRKIEIQRCAVSNSVARWNWDCVRNIPPVELGLC
jgi:hypothetical protein